MEYARYNAGRALKISVEMAEEECIRRQKQWQWKAQQREKKRASVANLEIKVVRPLAAEDIEVSTTIEMVTPLSLRCVFVVLRTALFFSIYNEFW